MTQLADVTDGAWSGQFSIFSRKRFIWLVQRFTHKNSLTNLFILESHFLVTR